MSKGRNAAKTFTATRAARFADTRRATEANKAAERAAGTRQTTAVVGVDDVRDDDEVCMPAGGFRVASEVDRSEWGVVNGQCFVKRFEATA